MPRDLERILITGANGHLGLRLIARIGREPMPRPKVRAVVRSERAAESLRALPESIRPEIVIVDYLDPDGIVDACAECDAVVHLVGILKESATNRYPDAHETPTTCVARGALRAGALRVVYLSILGSAPDSRNACLASKGRAEKILLEHAVPATILRVPMVLGRGDIAATALAAQARSGYLPLPRGGASLEQPIDAEDVVEAIWHALLDGSIGNHVLELAGPESLSHRSLVERVADTLATHPRILPLPLPLVQSVAWLLEHVLANPPLTTAMLGVLEHDDCIDPEPACKHLGIQLTPLDDTLKRVFCTEETPTHAA